MAKILVIEDDETQASLYLERLLQEGFTSTWAKDGEQGLEMALKYKPSLILLDIRMPKMDGLSVIDALRKDEWGKTVPVILITNLDPTDEIVNSISKNNASYFLLKKDIEPEDLVAKINDILANPPQVNIS